MRLLSLTLPFVLCCSLLASCAGVYRDRVNKIIGINATELQLRWGVPEKIHNNKDGTAIYSYRKSPIAFDLGKETHHDHYGHKDDAFRFSVSRKYDNTCYTNFLIGKDHKVAKISFHGSGCVAL